MLVTGSWVPRQVFARLMLSRWALDTPKRQAFPSPKASMREGMQSQPWPTGGLLVLKDA